MNSASPLCHITSVNSHILNNDHNLKRLPNGPGGGMNTYCAFTGGRYNKSPTTKTVF